MRTFEVDAKITLPVSAIAEAVGPDIARALIAYRKTESAAKQARAPQVALRRASALTVKAFTAFEFARHSTGERAAYDNLMTSLKGLRAAFENLQVEGHQS